MAVATSVATRKSGATASGKIQAVLGNAVTNEGVAAVFLTLVLLEVAELILPVVVNQPAKTLNGIFVKY
jgi:hypothetical protein